MKSFRNGAFTLVEMLVVIAIMLILAAILVPALGRAKEFGRAARCGSNLRQLQVAVLNFAGDDGHMPRAYSSWEPDPSDMWWHQHGWIAFRNYSPGNDGPYAIPPNNGAYGWNGPNGYACITNGSLWSYSSHEDIYLCPTFAVPKVCGQPDAMRSYSMNTNLHRLVLGGSSMSTVVLFGDDRNVTSSPFDGAFGTNEIATWHSGGRGQVVYADGQVEKR